MIKLRETLWVLFLSTSVFATTPVDKTVDALKNSSGGTSLSVPSSGSSLITDSNSVTLTNKTLDGSSLITTNVNFEDTSDNTKQLAFSLTGSTTGKILTLSISQSNSETLSIPNVGSSDSLVTNNTSATLTNKTLSGASNTFSQLPVGGQTIQVVITPYPDGSTTSFTLSTASPANAAVSLYLDGNILMQGAGLDYTISGSTITMSVAPALGQKLYAVYSHY